MKTAKKMQQGKFDLEDFLSTFKKIKKLGTLENLIKLKKRVLTIMFYSKIFIVLFSF